ncbi:hypothetical protein PVAND_009027 [Polypedilum vanderplanki]|uniref:Mitochondrial carrier protein n=1 Tax=Polypedilum vanderplanki TaxID=319348 RepID=A0A9J6CCV1_POLVA|nr:hypothetical protein PVAND_009027 [Polypedilum vanderplanki]
MENLRLFAYGGIASVVAEAFTFPLDLTKTRLQIQSKDIKYKSFYDCGRQIYFNEGIRGLYSGVKPALLRQVFYGSLKFGTYYTLKNFLVTQIYRDDPEISENIMINVSCAAFAGAFSSAICNPTDVLKVRLQLKGNDMPLFKAFYEIYYTEGYKGLYRGVSQTSQRAATIAAVELPVYDYCKHFLLDSIGDKPANHFISAFIASLLAAIACNPVDVIRTRLMNQRKIYRSYGTTSISHSTAYYANSFECLSNILRNEGVMALWKGFVPSFLRMNPWNLTFFLVYEKLKTL